MMEQLITCPCGTRLASGDVCATCGSYWELKPDPAKYMGKKYETTTPPPPRSFEDTVDHLEFCIREGRSAEEYEPARDAVLTKYELNAGECYNNGYVHGHDDNGKNWESLKELKQRYARLREAAQFGAEALNKANIWAARDKLRDALEEGE